MRNFTSYVLTVLLFFTVQFSKGQSAATDYYRSLASGNWSSTATWQSSPDNSTWISATLVPTGSATSILIRNSHTVAIDGIQTGNALTVGEGTTGILNGTG